MDRFIALITLVKLLFLFYLKSNMDRFIVLTLSVPPKIKFKIQYGQIYRQYNSNLDIDGILFKIQYGQIYSAPRDCLVLIDEIFKIQYGQIYSELEDNKR